MPERPSGLRPQLLEMRRLRNTYIRVVAYIDDTNWWSIPFMSHDLEHASPVAPRREVVSWKSLKRIL